MRIDVVSIFPDYLAPLQLSLAGKAQRAGLVEIATHDLRDWTSDRHRTVDDTPYGGGAGMVMRPEPWGDALDALVPADVSPPTLVVPTPAGRPFRQEDARRLAQRGWLLFACGRYEGIDQRVVEHAATRMPVEELSLGDYVLNGGEVAALAMIEAVVRLLPGFVGNPESLAEESHDDGLLEHPVYTKPARWRGLDVPAVLLSGDHQEVAAWRRREARERTARHRPDLLSAATVGDPAEMPIELATRADVPEIYVLQRCCWVSEAQANDALHIPPLTESLDDASAALERWQTWIVRSEGRLVGSVRARLDGDSWDIGRLMVAPDVEGRGLGGRLLEHAEAQAPESAQSYTLFTGEASAANLRMYRKAGYRPAGPAEGPGTVRMRKARR